MGVEEPKRPKPMSRFFILLCEIMEPIQIVTLGGSNMAWIRFIGESNHKMGHNLLRLGLNPEEGLMGCSVPQVKEWIERWRP